MRVALAQVCVVNSQVVGTDEMIVLEDQGRLTSTARDRPEPRPEPILDTRRVLIVTANEVPGYRITSAQGDVFGLIVAAS